MNKKNIFQESIDLQLEAKEIGLDWLDIDGVLKKLREETDEVTEAISQNNEQSMKEELGDLLFTFLCLTRHLHCDPENVLQLANEKFSKRYNKVLDLLKSRGKSYAEPEEMEELWQIIKAKKN